MSIHFNIVMLIIFFILIGAKSTFSQIKEIQSPAGKNSGEPNLFSGQDGVVFLSWVEQTQESDYEPRFSRLQNDKWSSSMMIAEGPNWFVNWADFPSLVSNKNGLLAAHWLAVNGDATYAYDINLSFSNDDGKSWGSPIVPHRDSTQTEHGFASLLPWRDNQIFAVWLDGRNYAKKEMGSSGPPTNEMTLRFALIGQDGKISEEAVLDERVCDCCQTSSALTENGAIVLYRNRSVNEVRDIFVVRYQQGEWSKPKILHEDGWEIAGCPVNGPSVNASGKIVAAAWFTTALGRPMVKMAFSTDEGVSFTSPVIIDEGNPIGRVAVVLMDENSALVSWLEATKEGAEIRARKITADGQVEPSFLIAKTGAARASGFPVMARQKDGVVIAYTWPGNPSHVKTIMVKLTDDRIIK